VEAFIAQLTPSDSAMPAHRVGQGQDAQTCLAPFLALSLTSFFLSLTRLGNPNAGTDAIGLPLAKLASRASWWLPS